MAEEQVRAAPHEVAAFVAAYGPEHAARIRFAWNGRHGSDLADENQEFRLRVVEHVCAHPGAAPTALVAELLEQSARWAREAWGAPPGFELLAALLLERGGEDALPQFLGAFGRSFDTYGACHRMRLDPVLARRLLRETEERAAAAAPEDRPLWEAGCELFSALGHGTAARGWIAVQPGAPVRTARAARGWRARLAALWERLRARIGGGRS